MLDRSNHLHIFVCCLRPMLYSALNFVTCAAVDFELRLVDEHGFLSASQGRLEMYLDSMQAWGEH